MLLWMIGKLIIRKCPGSGADLSYAYSVKITVISGLFFLRVVFDAKLVGNILTVHLDLVLILILPF